MKTKTAAIGVGVLLLVALWLGSGWPLRAVSADGVVSGRQQVRAAETMAEPTVPARRLYLPLIMDGYSHLPLVPMPNLVGMMLNDAWDILRAMGFRSYVLIEGSSSQVGAGRVYAQEPTPATRVDASTTVPTLHRSWGPGPYPGPTDLR